MRCKRVRKLFDAYRRGQVSSSTAIRIENHLAECPDCFEEFEKEESLSELIHSCSSDEADLSHQYYREMARNVIERIDTPVSPLSEFKERIREFFPRPTILISPKVLSVSMLSCLGGVLFAYFAIPLVPEQDSPLNIQASLISEEPSMLLSTQPIYKSAKELESSPFTHSSVGSSTVKWSSALRDPDFSKIEMLEKESKIQNEDLRKIGRQLIEDRGDSGHLVALEHFQRGEDFLIEQDLQAALKSFQKVILLEEQSQLAAVASLHLARIYFNRFEFKESLELYRRCVYDYPDYLSQRWKDEVLKKIQLLAQNKEKDFQPLAYFEKSLKEDGQDKLLLIQNLLSEYPNSSLVKATLEEVRQEVLFPKPDLNFPVSTRDYLSLIQKYIVQNPESNYIADAQLIKADILNFRLQKIRQARIEYARIFDMAPEGPTLKIARERLKQTMQLEIAEN